MTPIKYILVVGVVVFTVDHSGKRSAPMVAMSEEQAQWLGWSLCRAHSVPVVAEKNGQQIDISEGGSIAYVEEQKKQQRAAYKRFAKSGRALFEADPDCEHAIKDAPGGGVKCVKCTGWYCA